MTNKTQDFREIIDKTFSIVYRLCESLRIIFNREDNLSFSDMLFLYKTLDDLKEILDREEFLSSSDLSFLYSIIDDLNELLDRENII